jgi:hypothetical protein
VNARAVFNANLRAGCHELFYRLRRQRHPGFTLLLLPWDRNSHLWVPLSAKLVSAKLGMVTPEISRRNIIPEGAYLQK